MIFLLHSLIFVLVVLLITDYVRGRKTRARLATLESIVNTFSSRIARTEAEVSDAIPEELFTQIIERMQGSFDDFHERTMELRREVQRAHGRLDQQGTSLRAHNAMAHRAEDLAAGLARQTQGFRMSSSIERELRLELESIRKSLAEKTENWIKLFGPLWTTQDGYTVVPAIMSDSHLRNAMKWIEDRPSKYGPAATNENYLAFKKELARRDNDDTWHQRLEGGPSPRRVLADAVEMAKVAQTLPKFTFPEGLTEQALKEMFGGGMPVHDEIELEFVRPGRAKTSKRKKTTKGKR